MLCGQTKRWHGLLGVLSVLTIGLTCGIAAPAHAKATADLVTTTGRAGKTVALTFDDGPDPDNTPALLEVLHKYQVKAVFCLVGDQARNHPDLVRRIVLHGHTLCNHSMHHDDLGDWSAADIRADLLEASKAIREAVPGARIPYCRAPYGSWGQSPQVAADLGMQPLGWTVEVADWEQPGTSELVRRLNEQLTPGAVVLLHDGIGDRSQTVQAVDQVIPRWQAQDWIFTRPARPVQPSMIVLRLG